MAEDAVTTKDLRIHDLEAELAHFKEQAGHFKEQSDSANKALEDLQKRAAEYPSVTDFVHHCTDGSCKAHQDDLGKYLDGYYSRRINKMSEGEYQELGKGLGFYRLPEKISVGPGLAQRLKK